MNRIAAGALAATSLLALAGCKQAATSGNGAGASSNAAAPTGAASIDGTWKADINSVQFDSKPDEMVLQGGTFTCKSCTPSYSVPADGAFHPVTLPYADSDAVKVDDPHSITETSKKGGKQVGETTYTVSPDGNTLTINFTDTSAPGAAPKGEVTESRVGPAPAGAHATSGQWKPTKLSNFNDAALTFTVNVNGDTYHSSSPDGTSFDAKIGGGDVPVKGDIAGSTVSVTKLGDNSYKVTRKRNGKVVGDTTYTVGADGKLSGVGHNAESGSTTKWTATKQS